MEVHPTSSDVAYSFRFADKNGFVDPVPFSAESHLQDGGNA